MTNEENDLEGKSDTIEVDRAELTEDTDKGLSLRDALEVAVEGLADDGQAATVETGQGDGEVNQPKEEPPLEPPSEWDPEDKQLFSQSTRAQQEAALKLHKKRYATVEEIKREKAELQWVKELAKEAEPYLRSIGDKRSPYEAVMSALKMRNELDKGDPRANAASYLKAKGIEPPRELFPTANENNSLDEKIIPLQQELNSVKMRLAQEDQARVGAILQNVWAEFEQQRNAAGNPLFPDLGNTEKGLELASRIGSLVSGTTELSKQFIASAKERIPYASYTDLLREAYRYYGGRVDDSEAPRSQETQRQHLKISRRAASSVPGRGAQTASSGNNVKRYKTYREAAEAALAEFNSE